MPQALAQLFAVPQFVALVKNYFPQVDIDSLTSGTVHFQSIGEMQKVVILPLIDALLKQVGSSVTASGLENIGKPALFVSNHRDIVMDPTLLQYVMLRHNFDSTEIAIGDNLLATDWIRMLVRINKCFVVHRGLTPRDMARIFSQLSAYIRHAITDRHQSVWIAQREGRAKDSNDRTQESIIKMFALSGKHDLIANLRSLNIQPVSISYEYDPCDYLKAIEFQRRRDNADYRKAPGEDVRSMQTGITGTKGRVHYTFTPSINPDLDHIAATIKSRPEQVQAICRLIDSRIHQSYVIYPINRMAYSLLTGDRHIILADPQPARDLALRYLDSRLALITDPAADRDYLRQRLLEMYANPLINHKQAAVRY